MSLSLDDHVVSLSLRAKLISKCHGMEITALAKTARAEKEMKTNESHWLEHNITLKPVINTPTSLVFTVLNDRSASHQTMSIFIMIFQFSFIIKWLFDAATKRVHTFIKYIKNKT